MLKKRLLGESSGEANVGKASDGQKLMCMLRNSQVVTAEQSWNRLQLVVFDVVVVWDPSVIFS